MKNAVNKLLMSGVALLALANLNPGTFGQALTRVASGANPASIQAAVDQFRADLGPLNPNNGQSFRSGRREINWDGVPNNLASPNPISGDFFNTTSPRGAVFTST